MAVIVNSETPANNVPVAPYHCKHRQAIRTVRLPSAFVMRNTTNTGWTSIPTPQSLSTRLQSRSLDEVRIEAFRRIARKSRTFAKTVAVADITFKAALMMYGRLLSRVVKRVIVRGQCSSRWGALRLPAVKLSITDWREDQLMLRWSRLLHRRMSRWFIRSRRSLEISRCPLFHNAQRPFLKADQGEGVHLYETNTCSCPSWASY